jgi:hypothetical protein
MPSQLRHTMRLERSRLRFIASAKLAVSKQADFLARSLSRAHAVMSQLPERDALTQTAIHV